MALGVNNEGFWPPRIVVSGINRGANMGQDVTYSGTVSAALEATIHGIPGVAVSLDQRDANHVEDYEAAAQIAVKVVRMALTKSMPPFTIINLNVPAGNQIKGLRIVRQGVRIYNDELDLSTDGTVCRIVGPEPTGILDDEGTDLWALANGYASVTPIDLDLTAHRFMATVGNWDIEF
jgi:5'-nucleotidase